LAKKQPKRVGARTFASACSFALGSICCFVPQKTHAKLSPHQQITTACQVRCHEVGFCVLGDRRVTSNRKQFSKTFPRFQFVANRPSRPLRWGGFEFGIDCRQLGNYELKIFAKSEPNPNIFKTLSEKAGGWYQSIEQIRQSAPDSLPHADKSPQTPNPEPLAESCRTVG
jgi:hypothetical protein